MNVCEMYKKKYYKSSLFLGADDPGQEPQPQFGRSGPESLPIIPSVARERRFTGPDSGPRLRPQERAGHPGYQVSSPAALWARPLPSPPRVPHPSVQGPPSRTEEPPARGQSLPAVLLQPLLFPRLCSHTFIKNLLSAKHINCVTCVFVCAHVCALVHMCARVHTHTHTHTPGHDMKHNSSCG